MVERGYLIVSDSGPLAFVVERIPGTSLGTHS